MIFVQELASPTNELIMGVVAASALIFGGSRVVRGDMTMGEFGQILAAFGLLQEPIRRMNGVHLRVMQGLGRALEICSI